MSLSELIESYYQFKGMKMPDATDAHLFFVSEVGELADAIVSQKPGWVRNTPGKERNVEFEIGDCMQMLTVTALQMGLDPVECMKAKWASKGWVDVEDAGAIENMRIIRQMFADLRRELKVAKTRLAELGVQS